MLTKTFHYGVNGHSLDITVRTATGRDLIAREYILYKTGATDQGELEYTFWVNFVRALNQTVSVVGELGFAWPSEADDALTLKAARDSWLDLPKDLFAQWLVELETVDAPPVDPDLAPNVSDTKKKTNA